MARAAEIRDRDSLEVWLKEQGREAAVWIAFRAAARVLPVWWQWTLSDEAREREMTPLPVLRAVLTAGEAAKGHISEVKKAALQFSYSIHQGIDSTRATLSYHAANMAVRVSSSVHEPIVLSAALSAEAVDFSDAIFTDSDIWEAVSADAEALEAGEDLSRAPLWPGDNPLESKWQTVRRRATGPEWRFWLDWYQALLDGTPSRNPALWRDIALIDDEIWQQGPKAVAGEIAKIEEKYRLLKKLHDVESGLSGSGIPDRGGVAGAGIESRAPPHPRNHNNPPELLDNAEILREIADPVRVLKRNVTAARVELEQPKPDPARLRRFGREILDALAATLRYAGALGDIALKNAVAEFGKWGGRAGLAYLLLHADEIRALAQHLIEYAQKLI